MSITGSGKTHSPSIWRWSRKNIKRVPMQKREALGIEIRRLAPMHNVTRVIAPPTLVSRIKRGRLDLAKVSETDWKACIKPRTIFPGKALDLRYLQRVKRGPLQVLGSILGAWLRLKFSGVSKSKKYDYAFMVHPRTYADILRGVPFLEHLPKSWTKAIVKRLPPFRLSDMTGLKDINGKPLTGALMCIGWDREMFEADQRGREGKIADLVALAKRMGINFVGFAALLPWASRYGQCLEGTIAKSEIEKIFEGTSISFDDLKAFFTNPDEINLIPKPLAKIRGRIKTLISNKNKRAQFTRILEWATQVGEELRGMTITTGHPFTVSIIASFISKLRELHANKNPLVAVVGAAGSTGSCCCYKMAEDGVSNFLLVDRVKSTGVTSLADLKGEITRRNKAAQVETSTNLEDLKKADIVIVVSSAKGTIINSSHLKPGAIVVDDSQPRNVDPAIAKERPNIRVITVLAPLQGLIPDFYFDQHTPFTDACFTCAGDVSLRARTNTAVGATGPAQMEGVDVVERMIVQARKAGFDPVEPVFFTYDQGIIPYDEIEEITALTLDS